MARKKQSAKGVDALLDVPEPPSLFETLNQAVLAMREYVDRLRVEAEELDDEDLKRQFESAIQERSYVFDEAFLEAAATVANRIDRAVRFGETNHVSWLFTHLKQRRRRIWLEAVERALLVKHDKIGGNFLSWYLGQIDGEARPVTPDRANEILSGYPKKWESHVAVAARLAADAGAFGHSDYKKHKKAFANLSADEILKG